MRKFLKILAAVILLALLLPAALLFAINPNDYKPQLQQLAREQGIDLRLAGELGWTLWPSLGVAVERVSLTPLTTTASQPIAEIGKLAAGVRLLPLLSGQIAIDEIAIEQAHFHIEIDSEGRGNWQLPSDVAAAQTAQARRARSAEPAAEPTADQAASTTAPASTTSSLNLAVDQIELHQISADVIDQQKGLNLSLKQLNIGVRDFNTAGTPFKVALDWATQVNDRAAELKLDSRGELRTAMTLSADLQRYSFANTQLNTQLTGTAADQKIERLNLEARDFNLNDRAFPLKLDWKIALNQPAATTEGDLVAQLSLPETLDQLSLSQAKLRNNLSGNDTSSDQQLTFAAKITDLQQSPNVSLSLDAAPFNLKQLLSAIGSSVATNDARALTQVGVKAEINTDLNNIHFEQLQLQLDDTRIDGTASVYQLDSDKHLPKLNAEIRGDKINIDRYLPPSADNGGSKTVAAAPQAEQAAPAPSSKPATKTSASAGQEVAIIPVAELQKLRLNISASFEQMLANNLKFDNAALHITANKGLVTLKQLNADFYQGTIAIDGALDARPKTRSRAQLKAKGAISDIQIGPVLHALELDTDYQLDGPFSASFHGNSTGTTESQLLNKLTGSANIHSDQLILKPTNIEQQYCALVAATKQVQGAPQQWPAESQIRNLSGRAQIANRQIELPQLDAEVVNLKLGARGDIDLASGNYEIIFPVTLTQAWTSDNGCRTKEKFLIGRKLELLRAKGNLADESPMAAIEQNPEGVRELLKDYAEYELKAKLSEKLFKTDKKTGNSADKTDSSNSEPQSAEDALKDALIRGIFGR